MGKFRQFLTELSARNTSVFYFDNNLSKSQQTFTKFDICIYIVKVCLGIAQWQISSLFDRIIGPRHYIGGVLSFHVLFIINSESVAARLSKEKYFINCLNPI